MATKFAKNTNPWTGERPVKLQKIIDPTTLEICNDPLPIHGPVFKTETRASAQVPSWCSPKNRHCAQEVAGG
jgi:hypothetical protein